MPEPLEARFIRPVFSVRGPAGLVRIREAKGDEVEVEGILLPNGHLEVTGPSDILDYLNDRYGEVSVSSTIRYSLETGLEF
ncbi:MAG: hypothetical protein ACOYON_11040 [Fimbriimonas sp.]